MAMATIGLPFSDQDDYFEEALKSIFLQDHADWRLILVGDGPSEKCLALASLAAQDYRVELVSFEERRGLATRLNDIASMTRTPFLLRMDADDVMRSNRVSSQLNTLVRDEIDLVASRAIAIDTFTRVLGRFRELSLADAMRSPLRSHMLTHPTVAARTSWFQLNRYDQHFKRAEDKELWLRTLGNCSMKKTDEPTLFYRVRMNWSWRARKSSSRFDRRAVWKTRKNVAGTRAAILYDFKSRLNDFTYFFLDLSGQSVRVHRRKIEAVGRETLENLQAELEAIQKSDLRALIVTAANSTPPEDEAHVP